MKAIPLTRGKFAIVDAEDFDYLNQWKWWYTTRGYAVREENKKVIFMHRVINQTEFGFATDHINRDKLDNRKSNLRDVTQSQNFMNMDARKNNTSGHKGVQQHAEGWMARITVNYKRIYLGYFLSKEAAIAARQRAEALYHVID